MHMTILVTLDGSEASEAVLPVVGRLTSGTDAAVLLFTVGEPPTATAEAPCEPEQPLAVMSIPASVAVRRTAPGVRYSETKSQAIDRRGQELMAYLERKTLSLREWGIAVECHVTMGEPAQSIIEFARRHGVDLIAMADVIAQKTRELIETNGFREFYNPYTGKAYGAPAFGWSTLIVDMLASNPARKDRPGLNPRAARGRPW